MNHPPRMSETNPANEFFYSGALPRISRFMVVLAFFATAAAWPLYGWRGVVSVALGCVISYLNFHWLKRVLTNLADSVSPAEPRPSSKGVVLRFLLRYFLMGLAAYVIFSVSPASLYGLFAGLFLPVAAIVCEAAYEAYVALARGL